MPIANTIDRYGAVAKMFHWSIAIGIVLVIPLGILAHDAPYDTAEDLARKAWLFSAHKTVGVTLFFVALARITWALTQLKPAPLHPERRVETLLAEVVHWLLYGSLVLVPLAGWVHHAATEGFAPIWWPFGQNLPLVPESVALAEIAAGLHVVFERVLVLSLLLHIAGAVKHAVIDKDGTLARMLPGRDAPKAPAATHRKAAPMALAVVTWTVALGIGGAMGVYGDRGALAAQAPVLEQVDGEWTVTDGTLGLTIQQMGSEVTGTFDTWVADITFDETVTGGQAGEVQVEIDIASLTLGSVSDQAMQPDYFDASAHPTARFTADILNTASGYVAEGSLSLKGVDQTVSLPFTLTLEGDTAKMSGSTVLNRQSYGIGDSMTDPSQLGFEVQVTVALTATRRDPQAE